MTLSFKYLLMLLLLLLYTKIWKQNIINSNLGNLCPFTYGLYSSFDIITYVQNKWEPHDCFYHKTSTCYVIQHYLFCGDKIERPRSWYIIRYYLSIVISLWSNRRSINPNYFLLIDLDNGMSLISELNRILFNSVYRNVLFLNESHLSNETISLIDISKPSKFDWNLCL